MSGNRSQQYFDRKSSEWDVCGFLDVCYLEPFDRKTEDYIKRLETVAKLEKGIRRDRARELLDRYKLGTRPDRQRAKMWEKERSRSANKSDLRQSDRNADADTDDERESNSDLFKKFHKTHPKTPRVSVTYRSAKRSMAASEEGGTNPKGVIVDVPPPSPHESPRPSTATQRMAASKPRSDTSYKKDEEPERPPNKSGFETPSSERDHESTAAPTSVDEDIRTGWDPYFDDTLPCDYSFTGFYKHRKNQDDFSWSFQREADKLRKSLEVLASNTNDKHARKLLNTFEKHREFDDTKELWGKYKQELSEMQLRYKENELYLSKISAACSVVQDASAILHTTIGDIEETVVSVGKRKRKESDGGHLESNKDDKDSTTRYADESGSDDEASDSSSKSANNNKRKRILATEVVSKGTAIEENGLEILPKLKKLARSDSIGHDMDSLDERTTEMNISLIPQQFAPTWITDACQAIEKIRKMKDGYESPIWWRILDVRPMTNRLGPANKRAKEFVTEETLKMLAPPKLISRRSAIDEATDVVLNMVKSLPSSQILAQFQEFPFVGTLGILQNLSSMKSVQMDQMSLEELLENDVEIDVESGGGISITDEKMQKLARHADIVALAFCVYESIRYLKSGILHTTMGERTVDMHIFKSLFNILQIGNLVQIHYGEAESRASRTRRERIKRDTGSSQKVCGDHFDWLFASFLLRSDEIRGIEMGIAENVGPNHAETDQKAKANSTKVFKGNRDQWEELKCVIQEEAGGSLTDILLKGLLAVPMVGITLVGLTVRAHLVYCVGDNLFAVSEFGRCRLPDTVDALASAVESVRLFIRIRNVMNHSANIIQALIKKAKEVREHVSYISSVDDEIAIIQDFGTPTKPRTKSKLKINE